MMANWFLRLRYTFPTKALILLIVLLIIILPFICWNLQYSSIFIQGDLNYAGFLKRTLNNRRIAEARYFFSQQQNKTIEYSSMPSKKIFSKPTYPNVVFIIIAVDRNRRKIDYYQPTYLIQTMHTLFKSIENNVKLSGKQFKNISAAMCNADSDPSKFHELNYLKKYFKSLQVNSIFPKSANNNCKAKIHFLSCVYFSFVSYLNVDYFVVLEDDMISKSDAIEGLTEIFDSLKKRFQDKIQSRLSFVQLFYPLHEIHYSIMDPQSLLELIFLSCPLLFLLYVCYFRLHIRPMLLFYNLALLSLLLLICVIVVIIIGRPHWLSLYHKFTRTYHLKESSSSSTAAVLLTREFMKELIAPGMDYACKVDNSIFDFMRIHSNNGQRRILSSNNNLFKHIGLYSIFKNATINPHIVD